MPKFIKKMKAQEYIDSTRAYLDYLEEHIVNVGKAFAELTDAAEGKESWVGDDFEWHTIRQDVMFHDISKFTKEEFVQYRDNFFPITEKDKEVSGFDLAWENHKDKNHHHHETAETYGDIVHMLVDWIAMSYKFNGNPRDFYDKTKPDMGFDESQHLFIDRQLSHLESWRSGLSDGDGVSESRVSEKAMSLYSPPFKFVHGYIFDDSGEMVSDDSGEDAAKIARVRGWGRIQKEEGAAQLQDEVGVIIASALTEYWEKRIGR